MSTELRVEKLFSRKKTPCLLITTKIAAGTEMMKIKNTKKKEGSSRRNYNRFLLESDNSLVARFLECFRTHLVGLYTKVGGCTIAGG